MTKKYLWIEQFVIGVVCLVVFLTGLGAVARHNDESDWIATSNVFEAFVTGDVDSPLWQESYWTLTQPPLTRYVIGLSRWAGGFQSDELNQPWDWKISDAENIAQGAIPRSELLWWARLPMALLAVASIVLGAWLVQRSFGRETAYVLVALCLVSSYFLLNLRRAMGDALLLFLVLLVVVVCSLLLRQAQEITTRLPWRTWGLILLAGTLVGLAMSVKLNGLVALAGVGVSIGLVLLRLQRLWWQRMLWAGLGIGAAGVCTVLVFWALNPYLWADLLGHSRSLFGFRRIELGLQIASSSDAIPDLASRLVIVPTRIFETHAALPQLGWLVNGGLSLLGLAVLMWAVWQWWQRRTADPTALALLLVLGAMAAPMLATPLDWGRYYMFPVFFSTILIAIGAGWLIKHVVTRLMR
jgi:4-amino-4-deoxy-L-arabinose transferase-like glycosyltransferase